MNLAALAAGVEPSRPALISDGRVLDYAALDRGCARVARLLRARGVGRGDRVGIVLPNVPEFVFAYHGALRLGAIAVPLNTLLRAPEIELRVRAAEAAVLLAPPERHAELRDAGATLVDPGAEAEPYEEVAQVDGSETAVVIYTSGTTGTAKGAELTHDALRWNASELARIFELTSDDVLFGAAPLAHVLGQSGVMNAALASSAAAALVTRFEACSALELLAATGTTVFLGVPAMCVALLAESERREPPRLRLAHTGGAPLDPETRRAFETRFGCPVLEGYGMTEVGGVLCTQRLDVPRKPGSVGRPIDGMEIRIEGDPGEVELRGRCLMRGYRGEPDPTRDGWFPSGDVGYLDRDGDLFLVDRKKDVILRGGYNVYPREVEEVLLRHEEVAEAVVVGVPDARLGEEVAAVVVPRGGREPSADDLQAFVRDRIAAYKYPRLVSVVPELPHGPSGKILRREIDRDALRRALDERQR